MQKKMIGLKYFVKGKLKNTNRHETYIFMKKSETQ